MPPLVGAALGRRGRDTVSQGNSPSNSYLPYGTVNTSSGIITAQPVTDADTPIALGTGRGGGYDTTPPPYLTTPVEPDSGLPPVSSSPSQTASQSIMNEIMRILNEDTAAAPPPAPQIASRPQERVIDPGHATIAPTPYITDTGTTYDLGALQQGALTAGATSNPYGAYSSPFTGELDDASQWLLDAGLVKIGADGLPYELVFDDQGIPVFDANGELVYQLALTRAPEYAPTFGSDAYQRADVASTYYSEPSYTQYADAGVAPAYRNYETSYLPRL